MAPCQPSRPVGIGNPPHLPFRGLIYSARRIPYAYLSLEPDPRYTMGRKRRTAGDRAKLARENGYHEEDTFADDTEILKPMTHGSEDSYRESLEIWVE